MPRDYDKMFLSVAQHNKLLDTVQVQACLDSQARLGGAVEETPVARIAVETNLLKADDAKRIIAAINRKFPGKHPELETAAAADPQPSRVPETRMRPLRASSAARRSAPRPAAPPSPRKEATRSRWKAAALIVGVLAVTAAALLLLFPGEETSNVQNDTAATKEPPKKTPPPVTPEAPATPEPVTPASPEPPGEITAPPPVIPTEPPAETTAPAQETDPDKAAFLDRLRQKHEKALEKLAECSQELEEEMRRETEEEEALRSRLSQRAIDLKLRTGEVITGARIRKFSFTDAEIEASGRGTSSVLWETVEPASVLYVSEAIYDTSDAQGQFDRGRFLISRKMWPEAVAAFEKAKSIDDGFEYKVDEILTLLGDIIKGEGLFKGEAHRIGPNSIALTYSLKDAKQAEDFHGDLKIAEGVATLDAHDGKASVYFTDIQFVGQVELQGTVTTDTALTFRLFGDKIGYEIEVGPKGTTVIKIDSRADDKEGRRKELLKSDTAKLPENKPTEFLLASRGRVTKLFLDKKEVLTADDPPASKDETPPKGLLQLEISKGRAVFAAPFVLRGSLDEGDLERRFRTVENLVARAVNPDLEDVASSQAKQAVDSMLAGKRQKPLTSDDIYFAQKIDSNDIGDYEELKGKLARFSMIVITQEDREEFEKTLDALTAKYPGLPSLHYVRARWNYRLQNIPGAETSLTEALKLFPEFPEALTLQAKIHEWRADYDLALTALDRAIEAAPDYAPAYILKATISFTKDPSRVEDYLKALRLAQKLEPFNREAATNQRILKYEARGPRDLGCIYTYESQHYIVMTDISDAAAREYAARLEAAYALHYCKEFSTFYSERPFPKPRIVIFKTAENYYTYFELISEDRGEYTLGVFRDSFNEMVLFEVVDIEETLSTMYHEAFHHFMSLIIKGTPPYWYNEGIAEYMSGITVEVKDGKGTITERAKMLEGRLRGLQVGLAIGSTLSFERIMTQAPGEFYSGDVGMKYAQAWSMLHFFYEYEGGKYRPLIEAYLEAIRDGAPLQEAFDKVFKGKASDLEREWKEYAKKLKM